MQAGTNLQQMQQGFSFYGEPHQPSHNHKLKFSLSGIALNAY